MLTVTGTKKYKSEGKKNSEQATHKALTQRSNIRCILNERHMSLMMYII